MYSHSPVSGRFVQPFGDKLTASPVGEQSRPSRDDPSSPRRDPSASRVRTALDHRLRYRPTNQAQRAAARWDCIEALTGALVLDDGSLDVAAFDDVRDALQPGSIAAQTLGATGARHILMRLHQIEADASLPKRIEELAHTETIDSAVLPFVLTHAKRGAAHQLTPHDIGMVVLGALLDTVRQRNANNCAIIAERIEVHESSAHEVLDAIGLMLHQGLTEVEDPLYGCVRSEPCKVPVDDSCAWKARLRVGPISLATLMDVCPGCLPLADLLSISCFELAELFTCAALSMGMPGERIEVRTLIDAVISSHFIRALGRHESKYPAAPIRSMVDKVQNAMAASEGSLLLASWAMTVPLFVQRKLNSLILEAVGGAVRAKVPGGGVDEVLRAFSSVFHSDVRQILHTTEWRGRRDVIPSLRARAKSPRLDAIGPEPFRAMVREVLRRAVASMVPAPEREVVRTVEEYIQSRNGPFMRDVGALFSQGEPFSPYVPWKMPGLAVDAVQHLAPQPDDVVVFGLKVKLPSAGWVRLDVAYPPAGARQLAKATLVGWIELMRTLQSHPQHAANLPRDLATGTLVAASHRHSYRLLPVHSSWADAWRQTERTAAEWVAQEVVQPAMERGRKRYRTEDVRQILERLLENIALNDGTSRTSVVDEVLRSCGSRRLPGGDREYRLDRAVIQMSRLLRGAAGGPALSPQRDVRKRLCAAVQMQPETHGSMVVYGDTNWRSKREPGEPLLFGIAYDIVAKKLRRYELIEGQGVLAAPLQWCKLDDFGEFMPG